MEARFRRAVVVLSVLISSVSPGTGQELSVTERERISLSADLNTKLSEQEKEIIAAVGMEPTEELLKKPASELLEEWLGRMREKMEEMIQKKNLEIVGYVAGVDVSRAQSVKRAADEMLRDALQRFDRVGAVLDDEWIRLLENEADADKRRVVLENAGKTLAATVVQPVAEERSETLLRVFRQTTADDINRRLELQSTEADSDFLRQFKSDSGLSRVVRCVATDLAKPSRALVCDPDGLLLGGGTVARIRISGLPANQDVFARGALSQVSHGSEDSCEGSNPVCDQVRFPAVHADALGTRAVVVQIHTDRRLSSTYKKDDETQEAALRRLRTEGERPLLLISDGGGLDLGLRIEVGSAPTIVLDRSVPIAYERWKFESSTMFAVSDLTDEELVTVADPDEAGKVRVLRKRSDSVRPETSLFLNFVPRNYEIFGIGFGLHVSSERNISYYLGGSVRLLSLSEKALVSFSGGWWARKFGASWTSRRIPTLRSMRPILASKVISTTTTVGTRESHWVSGLDRSG